MFHEIRMSYSKVLKENVPEAGYFTNLSLAD